jgi:hypothetical protein
MLEVPLGRSIHAQQPARHAVEMIVDEGDKM